METTNNLILRKILYAKRHANTPDLHSFVVNIDHGKAFVEVSRYGTVTIDERTRKPTDTEENVTEWVGTLIEAANHLEALGADPKTISF